MIGYAAEFDSAGLSRLSRRLVEVLDPVGCDEREASRLDRDAKQAKAARHLSFFPDGHGSVAFRGSLPTLDAEPLIRLVDAYAQAERRAALDRLDPLAETVTPGMRRADALCALVAAHQQQSLAPSCGGDRPRVVVTLDYDKLRDRVVAAGLVGSGEPISAGELRRLACDGRPPPCRPRRRVGGAGRGPGSKARDARHSGRARAPRRRLRLPRLRKASARLPRPSRHPLVARWNDGPDQPSFALPTPPRPHRTRPRRTGPTRTATQPLGTPDRR